MYRGQDIGDREKLVESCLKILERGEREELFTVLPHISVVRAPEFFDPLVKMLRSLDRDQQEFAALALGSLGDPRAAESLYQLYRQPATFKGTGTQSLQASIIVALGELSDRAALDPLIRIYESTASAQASSDRRRSLIVTSLGNLAQQGIREAEDFLTRLLDETGSELQADVITELAVSYWHRPGEVPARLIERLYELTQSEQEQVRQAALAALSNLADLGCSAAEQLFED